MDAPSLGAGGLAIPSLSRDPDAELDVQRAARAADLDLRLEAIAVLPAVLQGKRGTEAAGRRVGTIWLDGAQHLHAVHAAGALTACRVLSPQADWQPSKTPG